MGIVWKLQPVPAKVLEEGRARNRRQRVPLPDVTPVISTDGAQA